jgi:glycosyltransferase involved in cell wall biosynthesis
LAIDLASTLRSRSAIFLRTSRLTREQYFKYRCNEFDLIASIGEPLRKKAQVWDPNNKIELVYDGISRDEIGAPKTRSGKAPTRILAIGAVRASKGWADLVEALEILESDGRRRPDVLDFTGPLPSRGENDLRLERLIHTQCNFLGRVDGFRKLVLGYDLVINPSRSESFGMAAVEVLAAGVPLLSSRAGVLPGILKQDHMLFQPSAPRALADAIHNVLGHWSELDFGVAAAQETIVEKFLIDRTAEAVDRHYRLLMARNPPAIEVAN